MHHEDGDTRSVYNQAQTPFFRLFAEIQTKIWNKVRRLECRRMSQSCVKCNVQQSCSTWCSMRSGQGKRPWYAGAPTYIYSRYASIYNASIDRHNTICTTYICSVYPDMSRGSYAITTECTYLRIYLLTPWSRVLLEKLTDLQLVKKFPTFYVTRRFITAFTSARHLSLS